MTTTWRPQQAVRAVAIGIIRRGDELLLVAVRDDAGAIKGWRPLGGSIEFGDRSWPTARRSSNLQIYAEFTCALGPTLQSSRRSSSISRPATDRLRHARCS